LRIKTNRFFSPLVPGSKFKGDRSSVLLTTTAVPELNTIVKTADGILFGSGVTINQLRDYLNTLVTTQADDKVFLGKQHQKEQKNEDDHEGGW
jgi:hypothetical protein